MSDDAIDSRNERERSERAGLSRRDMLKRTAGACAAAAGAGSGARAAGQVTGTTPEGGGVPLRLPMGALDYLDRNQYIHNMEIHAHVPGLGVVGGEPLCGGIWARGQQRLIIGGGGFVDITDAKKPMVLNKGQYQGGTNIAYNRTLKKWILLSSAAPPILPPTPQYPRGQYHPEYAARSINFTGLRGIRTYDATDPSKVVLLNEFSTGQKGGGTHMNYYDGGKYAYLDAGFEGLRRMESTERVYTNAVMIVDVLDPANVKEVSRWWVPGQMEGEDEEYKKWLFAGDRSSWNCCHGGPTVPKRVEDGGTVGYTGMGHFGMYALDLTDIAKPTVLGRAAHQLEAMGGIPYHSIYTTFPEGPPRLQNLALGIFESLESDCREPWHTSYVIDVKNPRNPKIIGLFPRPVPAKNAPYADFCQARGRFSAHNIQSMLAPGAPRNNFIALTYFNAGIRIYDISDPTEPKEVAYFVPARDGEMNDFMSWRRGTTEGVFVEWDRNLIWVTTHEGLYCMSTPLLGKPVLEPRKVARWSAPHFNAGWGDQTSRSVYFGRSLSQTA